MPAIMKAYNAHFTGAFVAKCPRCQMVCAAWDDEDLEENGDLLCYDCVDLDEQEGEADGLADV